MKARVKATGEIVEVVHSHNSMDFPAISYFKTKDGRTLKSESLDFEDIRPNPGYWERLMHQYAGMAMQVLLPMYKDSQRAYKYNNETTLNNCAKASVEMGIALVERMKQKEE